MSNVKITFCNRAYAESWSKNLERQSAAHFAVLQAIMHEIELKDGGDINKADICRRNPEVQRRINAVRFDIIPSRGQMLRHNGNGIRHAKFAPSKSIAIIWEKIGGTIFITFDDHAPIRYHRAIAHLRDIKLGRPAFPRRPRNTGRFLKKLSAYWRFKYVRGWRGINLRNLHYE
jgi:hypothetical protein